MRVPVFSRPFELHKDSAKTGLGAVLNERNDKGSEYVVAYASRSNKEVESKYSCYEGDTLAVV